MDKEKILQMGLTYQQVRERIDSGKVNVDATVPTKSVKRICYENIVTLFNIINIILFVLLILVGSYKNMLFMGVVVCNTAIGIIQEIRSKRSVDKLSILVSKKVTAVREGDETNIDVEDIVLDDIILLKRGSQIPSDCVVVSGECNINESLLTGESDLILKKCGDQLYSGSFVSSGECYARVNRVGNDNFASKINREAKYIKKVNSEIMTTLKKIIKVCSIIIFPVGGLLFSAKFFFFKNGLYDSVVSTVGALIGMIPEGLVLLTSSVLAVSVIRLSRSKVLVQELYCIETLARVDVLCLDKTGTITCDEMEVTKVIPFVDDNEKIEIALSSVSKYSEDDNSTIKSIREYCRDFKSIKPQYSIPFSSEKKWSGAVFEDGFSYIVGAAEFILKDRERFADVFNTISAVDEPVRILLLAGIDSKINGDFDSNEVKPLALVLIRDKIRSNAKQTISYFSEQGVNLKVISGDGVNTVCNIAKEAGIPGAEKAVDATTLKTDESIEDACDKYNVFGRVTPNQKKQLILALKKKGHTVAMTGDGVNDVLALKEADCSVAMAAGSEAARNVSQLVLINNDFSSMPKVVAEGRRTINNIQRSASLFLVKTIYSIVLAVIFIFLSSSYPFQPIQLSFLGGLTIGLPSFVLALQPNKDRIKGRFFVNVISRSIPGALCTIGSILAVTFIGGSLGFSSAEVSTMAVYMTAVIGVMMVIRLSIPYNGLRTALLCVIISGLLLGFVLLDNLLSIVPLDAFQYIFLGILTIISVVVFNVLYTVIEKNAFVKYGNR